MFTNKSQKQIESALLQWFKFQRSRGIPINGPILQPKANFFAKELNILNFDCTASRINRFTSRHNNVAGKISGESLSVQQSDVTEWQAKVCPNLRSKFSDDEIFNADETGLFYKLTPDKTVKFRDEKCSGGKLSKDRITVMVAANMNGTIKKKLLIIGKTQNPRCFKNVRSLPVDYESNRKAWMTSDVFIKWVRDWYRELTKKKTKVLLLVDNCPAHLSINDSRSITLIFLPPNTTSVLQPTDQGIIRALKSNFRKNLVLKIIHNLHATEDTSTTKHPKITILDAILMIYDAWSKLTPATISNCFKHAGFVRDSPSPSVAVATDKEDYDDDDDQPLSEWARALKEGLPLGNEELEQYSTVDDDLVTCEEPTDETILQNVIVNRPDSDDNNDDDLEENCTSPSVSEALKAAEVLNVFVHSTFDDDTIKSIMFMSRLHNAVRTS